MLPTAHEGLLLIGQHRHRFGEGGGIGAFQGEIAGGQGRIDGRFTVGKNEARKAQADHNKRDPGFGVA